MKTEPDGNRNTHPALLTRHFPMTRYFPALFPLFAFGTLALHGQSAEGLGIPVPTVPEAPSEVASPAATAGEPAPAAGESTPPVPSRYAGIDTPAYVEAMLARLAIQSRKTDAFGRFQDPEIRPPERKITQSAPTRKFTPEPPTPFSDVIAALQVTTIRPAHEMFLCYGRSFRRGDILPLALPNGKQVRAQVVGVQGGSIEFYNPDTKERATYRMNALPSGMIRGGDDRALPPGVLTDNPDAPLRIDLNVPLSGN